MKHEFRAITLDRKGFVYGSLIEGTDSDGDKFCHIECADFNNHRKWEVIPETVGQFIVKEVKQENHINIYEGDIIEDWKHGRLLRTFTVKDIRTLIREYDKSEHSSEWIITGNIHEEVK